MTEGILGNSLLLSGDEEDKVWVTMSGFAFCQCME